MIRARRAGGAAAGDGVRSGPIKAGLGSSAHAIPAQTSRRLAAAGGEPFDRFPLPGIGSADDVPVGRRASPRREFQHPIKGDVPIEATVVSEDEFVEIGVDVPAPQPVIGAQSPTLEQREDAVDPEERDVPRHLADDTRVMPVSGQAEIRLVAV